MTNSQEPRDVLNADALHSACVVDEQGREVPITRDMIRHSCEELERQQAGQAQDAGA